MKLLLLVISAILLLISIGLLVVALTGIIQSESLRELRFPIVILFLALAKLTWMSFKNFKDENQHYCRRYWKANRHNGLV